MDFRENETKRFNKLLDESIKEAERFIKRAEEAKDTEYGVRARGSVKRSAKDLSEQMVKISKFQTYV